MAFYDQEEEQDPNAQAGGQQTSQGSGLITGAGGAGTPQGQAPNAPDSGGNFVGLKTYLDANKTQSQKLGNQVTSQIDSSVNQAGQEVQGVGSKFDEKVNQGQIANIDTAEDEGRGILNQASTSGHVDDAQRQRFKQIANAQYQGPNSLVEAADIYQPVQQKVTEAQRKADLSKSEEGKQELLRGMNNSPAYTTGAQRFDSYLLNNDDTKAKLQASRAGATALGTQMSAAEQAAAERAAGAKSKAQLTAEAIRNAFGRFDDPTTQENEAAGAVGDYQNEINRQLQEAKTIDNALTDRVNSGQLTMDDLVRLGLENQSTYGVDLKNFYEQGIPTEAGVTDADEKARYDALMSLGDLSSGMYGGASQGDFGNYKPTVNAEGFNQAVNTSRDLYENTVAQQKLNDLFAAWNSVYSDGSTSGWGVNLGGLSNANDIAAAFNQLEANQNAVGYDTNYFGAQTALRDYLNNVLPSLRNKKLAK